ncbi:MAG: YihY/virulence factor BrkB family protein [Alphaproteobacteria bacterium]|nr:YihY/virulence factor BrkB family protein [Alphaproteobacteria bacterium]
MKKIFTAAFKRWLAYDPFTYSASAAYYAVLSMPGLLMTIIAMAALVLDRSSVEYEVLHYIRDVMGADAARTTHKIVESVQGADQDMGTMLAGTAVLLFGATGLFVQLQRSLNHIWDIQVKKKIGVLTFLRYRATAFGVMVSIGFLLLVSLSVTVFLTALSARLSLFLPAYFLGLFHVIDFVFSMLIVSLLFTLMFKVLPDARIKWLYAFAGGVITALFFRLGEYGLGIYFDVAAPQSVFGAAGSIILFMLWVYYSCFILLFGAQFSKACADANRERVELTEMGAKSRADV